MKEILKDENENSQPGASDWLMFTMSDISSMETVFIQLFRFVYYIDEEVYSQTEEIIEKEKTILDTFQYLFLQKK